MHQSATPSGPFPATSGTLQGLDGPRAPRPTKPSEPSRHRLETIKETRMGACPVLAQRLLGILGRSERPLDAYFLARRAQASLLDCGRALLDLTRDGRVRCVDGGALNGDLSCHFVATRA